MGRRGQAWVGMGMRVQLLHGPVGFLQGLRRPSSLPNQPPRHRPLFFLGVLNHQSELRLPAQSYVRAQEREAAGRLVAGPWNLYTSLLGTH